MLRKQLCPHATCRRRRLEQRGRRRPVQSPLREALGAQMLASLSPASLIPLRLWQKRLSVALAHIGFGCHERERLSASSLMVSPPPSAPILTGLAAVVWHTRQASNRP